MIIKYIADLCSNHNMEESRLIELIHMAKEIGCTGIKLQILDERLGRTQEEKDRFGKLRLPSHFINLAYHISMELHLDFYCTPFHPDFIPELEPMVTGFKIGSYELLWLELIETCAMTKLPITISCGGGYFEEIGAAFRTASRHLHPEHITLYHCIPHYPANPRYAHLYKISQLWYTYCNSRIGYSDHTVDLYTIYHAIKAGSREIEFHLDLADGKGLESHLGHCWKPAAAHNMILATSNYKAETTYLENLSYYSNMRKERTDPIDGMRGILNGGV